MRKYIIYLTYSFLIKKKKKEESSISTFYYFRSKSWHINSSIRLS